MMSNLLVLCIIANLWTGSALKIAVGDALKSNAAEGDGFGSGFTEEQTEALSTKIAATVTAAADGVQSNLETTTVEGVAASASCVKQPAAAFIAGGLTVTTPALPTAPAMTMTVPPAGAAAIAAAAPNNEAGVACARYALECSSPSTMTGEGAECQVECITAAGAASKVAVANLPAGGLLASTITKPAGSPATGMVVQWSDPVDGSKSQSGITVTAETALTISFTSTHATEFVATLPTFGGGGVFGDPKATNLRGEKFEILALGTFSLLSITGEQSLTNRLSLDATVDRAGEMCGATYIKNATMSGSWIEEVEGLKDVRVRAAPGVPKKLSLEVAFNENWQKSGSDLVGFKGIVKDASTKAIRFSLKEVTIKVMIDAHRIRQNGVKTTKYANFLNINVDGLAKVKEDGVRLGGLLGYDDHNFAIEAPNDCKKGHVAKLMQQGSDESLRFLSNIAVQ